MIKYRFQETKPRMRHLNCGFKMFLKQEGIEPKKMYNLITRYAYDNSDYTAWHLFFGGEKEKIREVREQLTSYTHNDKQIFNVSGNGYGTGICVLLNTV